MQHLSYQFQFCKFIWHLLEFLFDVVENASLLIHLYIFYFILFKLERFQECYNSNFFPFRLNQIKMIKSIQYIQKLKQILIYFCLKNYCIVAILISNVHIMYNGTQKQLLRSMMRAFTINATFQNQNKKKIKLITSSKCLLKLKSI